MPRSIFSVMTKLTNGLDDEPGASVAYQERASPTRSQEEPVCRTAVE